ncbi:glycogen synthase [Treponema sp.]|uniref:glycogen synthase n=1 Tax=Treponema sp. TaxID=166 RepID=UPI0025E8A52D|nr:glycogen/starch synthase [Treponema sp.]MCR5218855.1 glycogen/starch synthase [Treponema sp.]
MNVFMIAREYAGIAEAGGVKNVVCSLSETLADSGCNVTAFIPYYGCTDTSLLSSYTRLSLKISVKTAGNEEKISFSRGRLNGVDIIFIHHPAFTEKKGVYTYTLEEEKENPSFKKGQGHKDTLLLNSIFQKGLVSAAKELNLDKPDIIHCHDATAALVPVFIAQAMKDSSELKEYYKKARSIVTIHNAGPGYHHEYSTLKEALFYTALPEKTLLKGLSSGNRIEPFILAADYSLVTAVSPWYAREITEGKTDTDGLSEAFKRKNVRIEGIINGIDPERYNPENPQHSRLPYSFAPEKHDLAGKYQCRNYFLNEYASKLSADKNLKRGIIQYGFLDKAEDNIPCLTYHGRIAHQKGIDIAAGAARRLLEQKLDLRFIFAGQGSPELEEEFVKIARDFPGKAVYLKGYTREMARLSVVAADFSLHPSYFEPCGLEDFIAQLYGTIPVANATGGLKKILDEETGFLYSPNTAEKLSEVLYSLIKIRSIPGFNIFTSMVAWASKYVKETYSWKNVTEKMYLPLYKSLLEGKKDC